MLNDTLAKPQIDKLFDGELNKHDSLVKNFFESHFMEWFTYTYSDNNFITNVVNDILLVVNKFENAYRPDGRFGNLFNTCN